MNFFTLLESFLCLSTLGTIIPTIYLGKRLKSSNFVLYFCLSGLIVGTLFSFSNFLNQIGYDDLWGIYTCIPICLNFIILVYVIRLHELSFTSALMINFVLQILLSSSLPISNQLFIENTFLHQILTYAVLTGGIIFVFYNASLFMLSAFASKDLINFGTYLYIVLLVLIAFKPVSETPSYITYIMNVASQFGLWPLGLSLLIHLLLMPLLSFIPFRIMKSLLPR